MTLKVNRRDFLKLSAAALAGLAFRDFPPGERRMLDESSYLSLGRAVHSLRYYRLPSLDSEELGYYTADTVVTILKEASGYSETSHNVKWLKSEDGWFTGAYVQPVIDELNQPLTAVPASGMLVEVTVPYTQSYVVKDGKKKRAHRFYCKSTHWVNNVIVADNNLVWYQVVDDHSKDYSFVEAAHMRQILPEEISPISSSKSIWPSSVSLPTKMVDRCFQREHLPGISMAPRLEVSTLLNVNNHPAIWSRSKGIDMTCLESPGCVIFPGQAYRCMELIGTIILVRLRAAVVSTLHLRTPCGFTAGPIRMSHQGRTTLKPRKGPVLWLLRYGSGSILN